jgi:hypothetical protein
MIPRPRSYWRKVGSLFSRLLRIHRGGTADRTTSAYAYLWQLSERYQIDAAFYRLTGGRDRDHCRKAALDETYCALEVIERAEAVGILPAVQVAFEARRADNG